MDGLDESLVLLIPVLERPQNVAPLLSSIADATPEPYRVVFIADSHDKAEQDAVREAGAELQIVDGNYARKINHGVRSSDEQLIFFGADDLRFHEGWLSQAKVKLSRTIGVVGTNDLGNRRVMRGEHATHPLVARWYCELGTIDDPTKVLHEAYPHEFVDDEFIQTAIHRKAFAPALKSKVEHLHPLWGKACTDHLYDQQRRRMRIGRRIYQHRMKLWT